MAATDDSTENDEDVVQQRSEGGKQKEPVREKDGGDNASDIKEDLRGQQDACEADCEVELVSSEAVEHPA